MKPLNIRDPFFVMTIIALSFFWYGTCQSNKVDKLKRSLDFVQAEELLDSKRAEIRTLADSVATLRKKSMERASKDSTVLSERNRHISGLAKTVAELRKEAQPEIDSSAIISAFVRAYDSLNMAQNIHIIDMGLRHSAQIVDLNNIIDKQASQIIKERELGELWRVAAVESEKKVRKLQKGKVFRNVVIGVLTGGIVYLSLRE